MSNKLVEVLFYCVTKLHNKRKNLLCNLLGSTQ